MSTLKTIALIIGGLVLLVLLLAGAGILWLNANEYNPADREAVAVSRSLPIKMYILNINDSLKTS